ncbi:Target of rapamycin complex subunit lst8, partial [Tyrophagus putrescentiae]
GSSAQQQQQQQQTPYLEPNHYKNNVILVSGGYDHSIRYWNADKGFCERIVQQPDNSHINAFAITPNREILASAGFQHIRLYDINSSSQTPLVNFEGLSKNVCSIGFNHQGNWLYTGGEDGYVRLWDVRNRALHCQRQRFFQTPVNSTFLHPNGVDIYVADQSGSIYIWNLHKDKLHRLFVTSDGFVQSIAYDKDSRLLAAVDTRGNCYIFRNSTFIKDQMDESSGELTQNGFYQRRLMFKAHSKYALKCAFSPDSALLATCSADKTVKLWSTSDFSVANTTSVVQFDDPYDAMAKIDSSGLGGGANGSGGSLYKNTFSSLDTEGADVLDPSIANSNPTTAFMSTPYFVGLFNHTNQQPRPPPCYLRPKKLCQNCLDKRTSASTDQRTPEGVQAAAAAAASLAPGAAQHANSSDSIAGGRSMYHSPGCKQAYPSSSNAIGSVIPMQPTLNSLNQLTWNFKTPGKKLSDPGTCNHYSHYPYRSPTHRASVHSFPSSTDASTSKSGGSSAAAARKSDANPPSAQAPTASTASHNEYAPYRRFPVIAAKYFDNKYYEIHSGHDINTDSEEDEKEADMPSDTRNRIKLEREERKLIRRHRREQLLAEEKEEFYRLLKKSQLVDSSDEDSDEEEKRGLDGDDDEDSGLTMKSDFVRARNSNFDQEGNYRPISRSRHPSGNPIAAGSQLTGGGGKNEWNFTSTLTPKLTLKTEQQRWVWDMAFSADSQYIFTASSDQFVRLWSAFTGELTREYTGHQKAVMALGFSDLVTD